MIKKDHLWIIEELKSMSKNGSLEFPRKRGREGYAYFPVKWSIEGNFKSYGLKENGMARKGFMSYLYKSGGGIVSIDKQQSLMLEDREMSKILSSPNYISFRKGVVEKYAKELLEFCNIVLSDEKIKKYSNTELMSAYYKFKEIYVKYEFYSAVWFLISDRLELEIKNNLRSIGCSSSKEMETVLTSKYQSFTNRELIDLFSISLKVIKDKAQKDFFSNSSYREVEGDDRLKVLEILEEKYYWIPFRHIGPEVFDKRHYFNEISNLINESEDYLKKKLIYYEDFYSNVYKKQEKIFEKYNMSKENQRLVNDFHLLSIMQDERKEIISKTHFIWVNSLMKRIGSFFGLSGKESADLFPEEVADGLMSGVFNLDKYIERIKFDSNVVIADKNGYTEYLNKDALEFINIILQQKNGKELHGDCACNGSVSGTVRNLKSAKECSRVRRGDILVTTMTTPDFVPAMRNAAGIITDEGGATCHAAIVSRELGIPCIVNTKFATEVLKDGDFVQMNASIGKIKIKENE